MNLIKTRYSSILSQYSFVERCVLIVAINLKKLLVRVASSLESKRVFDVAVDRGWGLQKEGDSNFIQLSEEGIGACSVTLRRGTSDFAVFDQCLIERHYEPVVRLLRSCVLGEERPTIVDAGANIGLSVLYFARSFPGARIVALEPDEENFVVCCKNVTNNGLSNVTLIEKALWKEDAPLSLLSDFRDGREWAFHVSAVGTEATPSRGAVDGVSLSTLFRCCNIDVVDLLKVDIEGAEKHVFGLGSGVDVWLPNVRVVAVEAHDADGDHLILTLLQRYGFFAFKSGELTIGVNQRLVDRSELLEYFRMRSEGQNESSGAALAVRGNL